MSRIRTCKPELPSDPSLASVSRDARLTFVYLITQADDYGLFPAAPRQLTGMLYPHDQDVTAAMVQGWIQELVDVGICRWRITEDGLPVVQLVNWEKHQRVDNRRKPVLLNRLKTDDWTPEKQEFREPDVPTRRDSRMPAEFRGGIPLVPPTSDHGTSDQGAGETAAAAAKAGLVLDRLDHPSVTAACRGARNPAALKAELSALGSGMRGQPVPWPVMIRALEEMAAAGEAFTPARHRGYCRTIQRIDTTTPTADQEGTLDKALSWMGES